MYLLTDQGALNLLSFAGNSIGRTYSYSEHYLKSNFPMTPRVRSLVGLSVVQLGCREVHASTGALVRR